MSFDDIRIRLDIPHRDIGEFGLRRSGKRVRNKRIKEWGIANRTIRVRSVRNGSRLVIEGSFIGYLLGQSVVGTTNLLLLVKTLVDKVLARLGIKVTKAQQRLIDEGRIDLERLDFFGYIRVDHLGGPPAVLQALDVGLAGSRRNRMIFPRQTVVYHSHGSYWSLMFYDKAQHLSTKYPEQWALLDPRIQGVAQQYLRVELRMFGKELKERGWLQVRDVDQQEVRELFAERLHALLDDLRRPYPTINLTEKKLSKALLLGLLALRGTDLISGMPKRSQRRVRKQLKDDHGIDLRADSSLPAKYGQTLEKLRHEPAMPIRHGAPRKIRKAGLVALP